MITIVELEQTTERGPAQWEGRTDDDRPVYVRFRHGQLTVQVGPEGGDINSAVEAVDLFDQVVQDEDDPFLSWAEVLKHTGISDKTAS